MITQPDIIYKILEHIYQQQAPPGQPYGPYKRKSHALEQWCAGRRHRVLVVVPSSTLVAILIDIVITEVDEVRRFVTAR